MPIELTTRLVPIPGIVHRFPLSPLGLLAPLTGKWTGPGFNQIFRPNTGGSDNFLELNLTNETLEFTEIPGEIPNRGLLQQDISLFGLTYLQQVADANVKDTNGRPAGIHLEPGIWLNIPSTTDPSEPATVARLGNIPHGTTILAQGTASIVSGPPAFAPTSITPFFLTAGDPDDESSLFPFNSQTLANPDPFRSPPADIVGITQQMVDDPNTFLPAALAGKTITHHTRIDITTRSTTPGAATPSRPTTTPDVGGGVADIAFLDGGGPNQQNAQVFKTVATFWISQYTDAQGSGMLLQYSQRVILVFNGLGWPHVSVASLVKQGHVKPKFEIKEGIKEILDSKVLKPEIKEHDIQLPEIPPIPDPGPLRAGHAMAAPAEGRHFIDADERPEILAPQIREARLKGLRTKRSGPPGNG
jgi:hypothetical protein